MKRNGQLRTLGDIKTGISRHARGAPRREGSTFLEVYLLDKERQRLETELAVLGKRQKRIQARVAEIVEAREGLVRAAREASLPPGPGSSAGEESLAGDRWKRMPLEY